MSDTPHIFEHDYYQQIYNTEESHWWARGMRDAMVVLLKKSLPTERPLRVLDAGCGTGYILNYVKENYTLAHDPVGIDLSMHGLQFCRQRGLTSLALGSVVDLPFREKSFDLIICLDTIQHVFPKGADQHTMNEFFRLLKPGGVLYLRTNSALGHPPLSGVDAEQYRRYHLKTIREMAAEANLEVRRSTYLNGIPGVWGMIRENAQSRKQEEAIGPGLGIRNYPAWLDWLNGIMYTILRFESRVILASGLSLFFGHSTALVARRPE